MSHRFNWIDIMRYVYGVLYLLLVLTWVLSIYAVLFGIGSLIFTGNWNLIAKAILSTVALTHLVFKISALSW